MSTEDYTQWDCETCELHPSFHDQFSFLDHIKKAHGWVNETYDLQELSHMKYGHGVHSLVERMDFGKFAIIRSSGRREQPTSRPKLF